MDRLPTEMDPNLDVLDASEIGSTDLAEEFDKRGQWEKLPSPKIFQKILLEFYIWIVFLLKWIPSSMDCIFHYFQIQSAEGVDSTEEYDKQVQWAELPCLPLEKIYSFLSRDDQINMTQVCRKWSEGLKTPSVSKAFRFSLTESQLLMDYCPKIKCAEKYSRMLQHVEIDCIKTVNEHLIETWCKRLIVFLDILTENSQLISLKVRWPEICFLLSNRKCLVDLEKAIVSFVKSQHYMKRLECQSYYFLSPVDEFFKDMAEDTMHFVLRRFVDNIEPMDQESLNASQSLHVLLSQRSQMSQELPIHQTVYSYVFERMSASQFVGMDKLRKCQAMKTIFECYGSIQSSFRGLASDTWRGLKELHPDLQVELYFETDSQSRREVEFFIVPEMPITQLDYSFTVCKSDHSSIMDIDVLFNHILACKTNEHLISLRFAWILPIPDLASIFIPFLQDCSKLKCLQLFIIYPANGIDRLARSWLENRPKSLENVYIDISYVEKEDNYRSLMNLVTEYVSLLKLVGINIELKLNFGSAIFQESS